LEDSFVSEEDPRQVKRDAKMAHKEQMIAEKEAEKREIVN